jgi:hypothetical protein
MEQSGNTLAAYIGEMVEHLEQKRNSAIASSLTFAPHVREIDLCHPVNL